MRLSVHPSRSIVVAAYAGMCVIWSSTWLAIKVGLRGAPPLTGIAVRMTIASLIVLVILRARRIPLPRERRFVRLGLFLGFFHIVLPYTLVYLGEQRISSGLAAVLYATMPLFVALLARLALGDSLTVHKMVGIVAGMAGVAVIFVESLHVGPAETAGTLCVLGSVLASTVGSVATKRWSRTYHPVASLLIPFVTATVVTAIAAVGFEHANPLAFDAPTWLAILYLAGAGSVGAFSLLFFVLKHLDVTVVAYQTFIIPVLALFLGWTFLGEHVSRHVTLGTLLIFAGVSFATIFAPRRRERVILPRPQA